MQAQRITQILSSIQKSIHGLVGTPLPENLAPKFTTAMHDLEERFSTAIIKNVTMGFGLRNCTVLGAKLISLLIFARNPGTEHGRKTEETLKPCVLMV